MAWPVSSGMASVITDPLAKRKSWRSARSSWVIHPLFAD
jgi:hypothetical protein